MNKSLYPTNPVLHIDDEEQFLMSAGFILEKNGIDNIVQCANSQEVTNLLSSRDFSVIVLDMNMPHVSGWDLLPVLVKDFPDIPVIIITGINEVKTAVECMKTGAFDFLTKPIDDDRFVTTVKRAVEFRDVRQENILLKNYLLTDELQYPDAFSEIITQDSKMRSIFQYMEAISRNVLPVLITGDTGAGKELIARAIHKLSGRTGEFTPVNVAGVDDNLFSDTLFGHKRGAFTGADRDRKGMIEKAHGGTLFLDEIGDLKVESQVKLLRLLQDGTYYPVGSDDVKTSDARIIVATNQDIEAMQAAGEFRKDLYYRLQTHHIHIPLLKERIEDIKLLTEHFLDKAARILGKKKPTPPRELFILLENYPFPGNIRELESMVFDAVSRHKGGVLSTESFREKIGHKLATQPISTKEESDVQQVADKNQVTYPEQLPTLKEAEELLIEEAMRRSSGNQAIAAQMLGMTRRALNYRLNRPDD